MKQYKNNLLALTLFSIAMGLLEAAVVVYLRKLLYNGGFDFPVQPISDTTIAITEIAREAATLVMLLTIAYIYGRNFISRFAAFLFSFAIWDIFYYVFLKVLIDWPDSLLTWDVLFLIPVTWVGPVIAPVLVSFTMILYALIFLKTDREKELAKANGIEWSGFILGALIILLSFTLDPFLHLLAHDAADKAMNLNSEMLMNLMQLYIPEVFDWWIFVVGEVILLLSIAKYALRNGTFTRSIKV
jgi:hypothetical protein